MPIRKDGEKRWVEMELLVPGTPEQVWQAMATGPGNAAWFVRADIEPRAGGAFRIDFGQGATSAGEVTRWEPPHHFGYVEREWEPGAPPVATEITITARSGSACVVRMVHALFTSSDAWDDQVEGFEKGWPGFFGVLRVYLAHFAGMNAASFMAMQPADAETMEVWGRLCESLGLSGANVGERRTTESGPEPWSGIVEQVYQDRQQRWVLVRVDEPSAGIVLAGAIAPQAKMGDMEARVGMGAGTNVSVNRYFYGDGVEALAAEAEERWREWLSRTFAAEGSTPLPT
jgi:uncharacterized protein YndB with AHSA1/START domain